MTIYTVNPLNKEGKRAQLEQDKFNTEQGILASRGAILSRKTNSASIPPPAVLLANMPETEHPDTRSFIYEQINLLEASITHDNKTIERQEQQINTYTIRLREIQAQIKASTNGLVDIDTEKLELELRQTCKFYEHDSLFVHQTSDNPKKTTITWNLNGIHMKPTYNPFLNVTVPPEGIPLAPITIQYKVESGRVQVLSRATNTDWSDGWNNGSYRPHPHIMSGLEPCYGSFAATKFACTEHADVISLNAVMVVFLQTANTDDSSGRYWPSYIINGYHSASTVYVRINATTVKDIEIAATDIIVVRSTNYNADTEAPYTVLIKNINPNLSIEDMKELILSHTEGDQRTKLKNWLETPEIKLVDKLYAQDDTRLTDRIFGVR